MQDLRIAFRTLRKSLGFAIFAIVTLALGIGANTAIFSVIDNVLLRPLPYPDADSLVTVNDTMQGAPVPVSIPEADDYRQQSDAFVAVAALLQFPGNLTGGDHPERIEGLCVSPGYFAMLGVPAHLGRTFTGTDETPGISSIAVISDSLWRSRFGGRAEVIGARVELDDDPYTIVGVMPKGFAHPARAGNVAIDVWVACGYRGMPFAPPQRNARGFGVMGRLKPGVSVAQAQERLDLVAGRLHAQFPGDYPSAERWGVKVRPLAELVVGDAGKGLVLLFGAVGFVLLIACTNVAILLLARAAGRRKELTVRAALGASRARLVRQLFTESMILAVFGGAGGILLAMWATDLLVSVSALSLPRATEVRVDLGVLAFTLGLSVVTALLFGLLPAVRASRTDLQAVLKEGGRSMSAAPGGRLRTLLVVAEVALATTMLVGAGLLMRSLNNAENVEPGFDPEHVARAALWLPLPNDRNSGRYNVEANREAFAAELLRRTRAVPGIESAALASALPLANGPQRGGGHVPLYVVGRDESRPTVLSWLSIVSDGYFETLRIPLLGGRGFAESDVGPKSRQVAVVNRTMAEHVWPGADPLGATIRVGRGDGAVAYTVVGVAGDVRSQGLDVEAPDEIYLAFGQQSQAQLDVVVREKPGSDAAQGVPAVVRSIDQHLPVSAARPLNDVLADAVARRRFVAFLLGLFAAAALGMAALGIYGVTSYAVAQRQHEIGLRMAVGARSRDVLALILGNAIKVVGAGVAVGLVGAAASGRMVSGLLYGVGLLDPLTFGGIAVLLVAVALLASWLPARRATRVDPMIALRSDT